MKLGTLWIAVALVACGGPTNSAQDGTLNGHCYPNNTCNAGLTCTGGVCQVVDETVDAAIDHDAAHPDGNVLPDGTVLPDGSLLPDGGLPDAIVIVDGGVDSGALPDAQVTCDVLTQTGCGTNEKCTWIIDVDGTSTTSALGHNGCAPTGAVANGAACTILAAAQGGYDNCIKADVCVSGTCKAICNNAGGTPACGTNQACVTYDGLFANSGQTATAGVCDPSCNPLDDNDFDGSGAAHTKSGTACGTNPVTGCYGIPDSTHTTFFTCAPPAAGTGALTHRSPVPAGQQFLNSCMSGYELSVFYDTDGGTQIDCFAWCKPGESDIAISGGGAPNGVAPHRCNNLDALGNFTGGTPNGGAASNGEHCWYSWYFEIDANNLWHVSPTSDTVGICIDHTKYHWDSNHDGTVGAGDAVFPPCASLPVIGTSTALGASDIGCVSSTTAGLTPAFAGKAAARRLQLGIVLPELPNLAKSRR